MGAVAASHGDGRQKCPADVQPGGSQPEARNISSPSSQSGLWAGGETAPQAQGTGQRVRFWLWGSPGFACVKLGRSGQGDFTDVSFWGLFLKCDVS